MSSVQLPEAEVPGAAERAAQLLASGSAEERSKAFGVIRQLGQASDVGPLPELLRDIFKHVLCVDAGKISVDEWFEAIHLVGEVCGQIYTCL